MASTEVKASERIIPIKVLNTNHETTSGDDSRRRSPPLNDEKPSPKSNPERHSLIVTLDDGTTTETQGSIEDYDHDHGGAADRPSSRAGQNQVRNVPIKLADGKVIQRSPDESMEIRAEFTNYSHQEFDNNVSPPEIPRMDSPTSPKSPLGPGASKPDAAVTERVVPIRLEESGETIMPSFTKLEDPTPPDWSAFSKANKAAAKAKEKVVPLIVDDEDDSRSRERSKSNFKSSQQRSSSSNGPKAKNSVRFDLQEKEEKTRSETTTKRSSSVETYTRITTSTGKPPRPSTTSTTRTTTTTTSSPPKYSPPERPASATPLSPGTEKTLQDIDRDITKIWKELQELEKFPAGSSNKSTYGQVKPPHQIQTNGVPLPVTPVRVKATYTATPQTTRKWTPSPQPPRKAAIGESSNSKVSFSTPVATSTPKPPQLQGSASASTTPSIGRRTIWDTDPARVHPSWHSATPQGMTKSGLIVSANVIIFILWTGARSSPVRRSPARGSPSRSIGTATSPPPLKGPRMPGVPPPPPAFRTPATTTSGPGGQSISRPQPLQLEVIKAPIARDESFFDLVDSKSPSVSGSFYDNSRFDSPSGIKGFPYIDGAPCQNGISGPSYGMESPGSHPGGGGGGGDQNGGGALTENNFSVLVDKSTQTSRSKESNCCIL